MTDVNLSLPDFSAGEISPKMYGRFDLAAYFNGARRVENFTTQVQGPAQFDAGTVFSSSTRLNQLARFHRFKFNNANAYAMEFTDQRIRFHRNNGQVRHASQDITGITQANPAVVTYSGADNYSNGDSVFISGVIGMTQVNNREFIVANVDTGTNTFELQGIDSTSYTAYSSGGIVEKIVEVTTPYTEADLFQLKFAQIGKNIYIAHPSYNPKKLTYTSATSWAIADHTPTGLTLGANDYPSAVGLYEQRLVYGGSNNNPNTLNFSKAGDVDNFTTGTNPTDGVAYTIAGSANKISWLNGTNKFLAVGAVGDVYQVTGGIDNVITPTSISIRPSNSYGVSDIMPVGKGTQIFFVQSNELIVRSFQYEIQQDGYTPIDRNTIADHITKSGIKQIDFMEGRPNILWAVRNDGVLIGLTIEDGESISGWHRHTTDGEYVSVCTIPREGEYDQLWACVKRTIDGQTKYYVEYFYDHVTYPDRNDYITELTRTAEADDNQRYYRVLFESQKEYIHVHSSLSYYGDTFSGTMTPASTSGTSVNFTSSASIFTSGMIDREIWRKSITGEEKGRAKIKTYTNASTVVCEILEEFDSTTAIPEGEWYLTTDEVSGLEHLEGKEVVIVTDGGQHPVATVTDGAITLDKQSSVVHVGLGYTGYLETNELEGGGTNGVAQTKKKNVYAIAFRFLETLYAKYGTSYYNLETIEMRTSDMSMDRPPVLFTGDTKEKHFNDTNDTRDGGWSRSKRAVVIQDQPFPCSVQLIVPYVRVSN